MSLAGLVVEHGGTHGFRRAAKHTASILEEGSTKLGFKHTWGIKYTLCGYLGPSRNMRWTVNLWFRISLLGPMPCLSLVTWKKSLAPMPAEVQSCHGHAEDMYTNPESYIHPFQNSCFDSSAGPLACARCASGLGACHCGFRWPAVDRRSSFLLKMFCLGFRSSSQQERGTHNYNRPQIHH